VHLTNSLVPNFTIAYCYACRALIFEETLMRSCFWSRQAQFSLRSGKVRESCNDQGGNSICILYVWGKNVIFDHHQSSMDMTYTNDSISCLFEVAIKFVDLSVVATAAGLFTKSLSSLLQLKNYYTFKESSFRHST